MRRIKLVLAVAVLMLTIMAASAVPAMADIFNSNGCDSSGNNCDFSGNNCTNTNSFLDTFFWSLFGDGGPFGNNCDPTNNGVSNWGGQDSSSGNVNQGWTSNS